MDAASMTEPGMMGDMYMVFYHGSKLWIYKMYCQWKWNSEGLRYHSFL